MITAHHGGEAGLLAAVLAGAGVVPVMLLPWRARLGSWMNQLRHRSRR